MPQSEKIQARIQSLDERLARLRMKKGRLLARAGHVERKRDTRRKILIGGAVLAAVGHEGVPALRTASDLLQWTQSSGGHTIAMPSTWRRNRGGPENSVRPYKQAGPQRSGGQGCRPAGGTARRRAASLTAARAKGIVPRAEREKSTVSLSK